MRIARALLRGLERQRRRLERHEDEEALHDFRVALRRLRSWLRAWSPLMRDRVDATSQRALRAAARATGGARDAEVALAWLRQQRGLPAGSLRGVRILTQRLRRERRAARRHFSRRVARRFERVIRRLERQLASDRPRASRPATRDDALLGAVAADLVRMQALGLGLTLGRVRSEDDGDDAHRARIAGKRLRYLLELLARGPRGRTAIARLVRLQAALGEVQDARVLLARIGAERRIVERKRPAGGPRDPRIGLDALNARAIAQLGRAFTAFSDEWLAGGGGAGLLDAANAEAARFERTARPVRSFSTTPPTNRSLHGTRSP